MTETLSSLLEEFGQSDETTIRSNLIYQLSEPVAETLAEFVAIWPTLPTARRQILFSQLVETGETNFELDFTLIAEIGLGDEDETVRRRAIDMLWHSTDRRLAEKLIEMMDTDASDGVRESAAAALGRYVLAGELGELPLAAAQRAEEALLKVLDDPDTHLDLYRRALESLAYSSRDELKELVAAAAEHPQIRMRASALHAMGLTADLHWESHVVGALNDDEPEIRYEAARASGELASSKAVPGLLKLLDESDREIQEAAVWALGEIGGDMAEQALGSMLGGDWDDSLQDAIEDALEMAALVSGRLDSTLFELDESKDLQVDDLEESID